jgi:hypothetical protein
VLHRVVLRLKSSPPEKNSVEQVPVKLSFDQANNAGTSARPWLFPLERSRFYRVTDGTANQPWLGKLFCGLGGVGDRNLWCNWGCQLRFDHYFRSPMIGSFTHCLQLTFSPSPGVFGKLLDWSPRKYRRNTYEIPELYEDTKRFDTFPVVCGMIRVFWIA